MPQTIKFEVELEADMVDTELTNDIVNRALEDSSVCATAGYLYIWGEYLDDSDVIPKVCTTWDHLAEQMMDDLHAPGDNRATIQSLLNTADRLRKEMAEFDAENNQ